MKAVLLLLKLHFPLQAILEMSIWKAEKYLDLWGDMTQPPGQKKYRVLRKQPPGSGG